MESKTRAEKLAVYCNPQTLTSVAESRGAWYQTEEEVEQGLEWGRRKRRVLAWIEEQMESVLTRRERECVDMYFFRGLNYRQIGQLTNTNASSVLRGVQRAIRKLKLAAGKDNITL